MGCAFCASTLEGCVRDLNAGEMLAQILLANRYLAKIGNVKHANHLAHVGQSAEAEPAERVGHTAYLKQASPVEPAEQIKHVGHIVLMGSGEPFDNYAETIRFLRLVNDPDGLHISLRNISVSTCGLVPQIYELANEGLPITLSISLHAPNDVIRRKIMPIAKRYPLSELMEAARAYVKKTGRRVVFEYALIDGLNSEPTHARELSALLKGLQCHVNLIPLNQVEENSLRPAKPQTVRVFLQTLESLHISATCRREMGTDIRGACGQLRHQYLSVLVKKHKS